MADNSKTEFKISYGSNDTMNGTNSPDITPGTMYVAKTGDDKATIYIDSPDGKRLELNNVIEAYSKTEWANLESAQKYNSNKIQLRNEGENSFRELNIVVPNVDNSITPNDSWHYHSRIHVRDKNGKSMGVFEVCKGNNNNNNNTYARIEACNSNGDIAVLGVGIEENGTSWLHSDVIKDYITESKTEIVQKGYHVCKTVDDTPATSTYPANVTWTVRKYSTGRECYANAVIMPVFLNTFSSDTLEIPFYFYWEFPEDIFPHALQGVQVNICQADGKNVTNGAYISIYYHLNSGANSASGNFGNTTRTPNYIIRKPGKVTEATSASYYLSVRAWGY